MKLLQKRPAAAVIMVLAILAGAALGQARKPDVEAALTGDFLYGTEDRALIPRPALHSGFLSLLHPITRKKLEFSIPLPEDMARLRN